MQALLLGPVSIGVDASKFYLYKSGIINDVTACPPAGQIDHAILLVGYGTGSEGVELGIDYWRIKNSWNTNWGEEGYLRIARGQNLCEIANGAAYPTGAMNAAEASPSPPETEQCPAISPPPPMFPEAYSVNVTQEWGNPQFPDSGLVQVSYGSMKLRNGGYMQLDTTKLYRCDLAPNQTFHRFGIEYYIKNKGQTCDVDPLFNDTMEHMTCPWSRWTGEIMSQLITASPDGTPPGPCPINPYAEEQTFLANDTCNKYSKGMGTDFSQEYWITQGGIPIKEVMTGSGAKSWSVTSYYSDYKVGEPESSVFDVPEVCNHPEHPDLSVPQEEEMRKERLRAALFKALHARAIEMNL